MDVRRKRILMACCLYWNSPFQVGSHHLARHFAKAGWDVAFISDPISPFHALGGISNELRERFSIFRAGGQKDLEGRLWTYVPAALATPHNKPILRSETIYRHWPKFTLPPIVRRVKQNGFDEVDLLYFDSITQAFWLNAIPHKRSIFRIADNNSGFGKSTVLAQQLEHELARSVDTVVYTAESLKPYVERMGPKSLFHLPNGVNFEHFAGASRPKPAEYNSIPGPIAIYVGAMDVWFDFALVNELAKRLPGVSFVLIGPDQMAREHLEPRPNLHLLGRRPYGELPAYLQHADVGLIPFDVANHPTLVNGINPLKLYEYLACGLPVVCTEWEELRNLRSPATLCNSVDEFTEGLLAATAIPPDRTRLVEYARAQDWSLRVSRLAELSA